MLLQGNQNKLSPETPLYPGHWWHSCRPGVQDRNGRDLVTTSLSSIFGACPCSAWSEGTERSWGSCRKDFRELDAKSYLQNTNNANWPLTIYWTPPPLNVEFSSIAEFFFRRPILRPILECMLHARPMTCCWPPCNMVASARHSSSQRSQKLQVYRDENWRTSRHRWQKFFHQIQTDSECYTPEV